MRILILALLLLVSTLSYADDTYYEIKCWAGSELVYDSECYDVEHDYAGYIYFTDNISGRDVRTNAICILTDETEDN